MYEVEYVYLNSDGYRFSLPEIELVENIIIHNKKVDIFKEFGLTPEKRSAAFGVLKFRSGPVFTNSVMWYTVCERRQVLAATYPIIKKETLVLQNRYQLALAELFPAPFV